VGLSEFSPTKLKSVLGGAADDLQIAKLNLQLFAIHLQNIDTSLESIGQVGGAE
jgi:hypothetical protein